MSHSDILTNEFQLTYDESQKHLLVYGVKNGQLQPFPIKLRLSTLSDMGAAEASKWVGETILLLIPEMREQLFGLPPESESEEKSE